VALILLTQPPRARVVSVGGQEEDVFFDLQKKARGPRAVADAATSGYTVLLWVRQTTQFSRSLKGEIDAARNHPEVPVSKDRGRPKSVVELLAEAHNDPRFARNAEAYRLAARGVVADLRELGYNVEAVGDLRKLSRPYPEAVPILARWLGDVSFAPLREDIVRTLSVPWAGGASRALVEAFESVQDATGAGIRWIIGNALEALASDAIADDLIRLATDRRYGRARERVVVGLGKLTDLRVVAVLLDLLGDDELVGHAASALGTLRVRAARPRIEPLLSHARPWVRNAAKKALARIDKAR
jgi:HEAT repeat protein